MENTNITVSSSGNTISNININMNLSDSVQYIKMLDHLKLSKIINHMEDFVLNNQKI